MMIIKFSNNWWKRGREFQIFSIEYKKALETYSVSDKFFHSLKVTLISFSVSFSIPV